MGVKDKTEIQRRFEEIMEKKLNNKFISTGTLIRFRNACIEFGKQEAREGFLKWLKRNNCAYGIDELTVNRKIKQLKGVKRK